MSTTQHEAVVEAAGAEARLPLIMKLLAKAEHILNMPKETLTQDLKNEAEALNERAADLIAKYGIDRAMLAAVGAQADSVVDEVMWLERPFAEKMRDLLWNVAVSMRGQGRWIKQWDTQAGPKAKGGVPRGGWRFGIRVFAYQADLELIKLQYASARNQALAGVSKVVNRETEFGQAQKADRESWLDGFNSGIWGRLQRAARDAQAAREAEQEAERDQALLDGKASGPGVALVLADRKKAVSIALDAAYGITQEQRAQWAADGEKAAARAREEREARAREIAECKRCQAAKSGRCNQHRETHGRSFRYYERTGTQYEAGYRAGQEAELVVGGPGKVSRTGRAGIED